MSKIIFITIFLTLSSLIIDEVKAEGVDIANVTCKDYLSNEKKIAGMTMWIDGYLSALSNNTVMTNQWLKALSNHMGEYCVKNPTHTIMQAIDALPEEDKF